MSTPPAGISAADWHSTPESVRDLVAQLQLLKQENEQLGPQRGGVRRRLGRHDPQFRNLADPPNLEFCTRDV